MPTKPPAIRWSDQYSVGVAEIDTQHQRLLALLNKLNAADNGLISSIARAAHLLPLLEELNEYAVYHFLTEEKLMRDHLPPDDAAAKHLAAHRSYWQIMSDFKQRHRKSDPNVGHELMEYLNRWWLNHIMHTDKQFGAQLNQQGID